MPTIAAAFTAIGLTAPEVAALGSEGISVWDDLKETLERVEDKIPGGKRKGIIALMHFCHDCVFRLSLKPEDVAFDNTLVRYINHRAVNRAELKSINKTALKEASPGKLKGEASWDTWQEGLRTYLGMIPGVRSVPLSYVIRENPEPQNGNIDWKTDNFLALSVDCAPLTGMDFDDDARQVHQIIKSLVQGETSENWIKHLDGDGDGRKDFFALRNFYHGQGNANRRIQEADKLLRELFYKGSEKTFPWERYVKEFKRMCDIFEEEGQPLHDKMKTRSFLERIQVPSLKSYVEILQNEYERSQLTWEQAANRLANHIAKYKSGAMGGRLIGSATTGTGGRGRGSPAGRGGRGGASGKRNNNRSGKKRSTGSYEAPAIRYNQDGTVYTGTYPDWSKMSAADRATVNAAREQKRQRQNGTGTTRNVSSVTFEEPSSRSDDATPAAAPTPAPGAGTAFGGRAAAARGN
jgi:hypothetical protein